MLGLAPSRLERSPEVRQEGGLYTTLVNWRSLTMGSSCQTLQPLQVCPRAGQGEAVSLGRKNQH